MRDAWVMVCAGAAAAVSAGAASGSVEIQWNNPAGGAYFTPTNWTPNAVPSTNYACTFGLAGSYAVNVDQSQNIYYQSVYRGDVTFDLQGHTVGITATNSITNPGFYVRCADANGTTSVRLVNGTYTAQSAGVGDNINTDSRLTIGTGGVLRVQDDFALSFMNGTGRLRVENGGQLVVTHGGIDFGGPQQNVCTGHATVTGAGSSVTSPGIWVGLGYVGSLLVENGGQVNTNGGSVGGYYGAGSMAVRGAGSRFQLGGPDAFVVGPSGNQVDRSKMAVLDGGVVGSITPIEVQNQGMITGNSRIEASVNSAGNVAPGAFFDDATRQVVTSGQIGTLHITGAYSQSAVARLSIELAGPSAYDVLVVDGTSTLHGFLNVSLAAGFVPEAGQSFTFLTSTSRIGTFDLATLPSLPIGRSWSLQYTSGGATLSVLPAPGVGGLAALCGLGALSRRRRFGR